VTHPPTQPGCGRARVARQQHTYQNTKPTDRPNDTGLV